MKNLKGKWVLVTGASRGIGRLFGAQEFAGMTLEEAVEAAEKKPSPYL